MELVENVWSINQVMELEPWNMRVRSTEQYPIISHNVFTSSSASWQWTIVPFSQHRHKHARYPTQNIV